MGSSCGLPCILGSWDDPVAPNGLPTWRTRGLMAWLPRWMEGWTQAIGARARTGPVSRERGGARCYRLVPTFLLTMVSRASISETV